MRNLIPLILVTFVASGSALNGTQTKFIEQPLSHYMGLDYKWDQRYFVNADYFLNGGPIFIYIGYGFEYYDVMYRGEVFNFNKELNGLLFGLEHRFYGASRPTRDASYMSLEYLTVEQALADIAEFIQFIKDNYEGTANSKVILYGERYGSALAVWARQKYPHLVDGVWASSAYLSPVVNHLSLAENIGRTFKRIGGQQCYDVFKYAFETLEVLVWSNDTETIKTSLKQCKDLEVDNSQDVNWLFLNLVQVIQNYLQRSSYQDIETSCEKLVEDAENQKYFDSFSNWLSNEVHPNVFCMNFNYNDMVKSYREWEWETVGTVGGARQDMWLHCNQLGQFATSEAIEQPFGNRFKLHVFLDFCEDLFPNTRLEVENKKMYTTYGDRNLNVRNVFFTNGEFDPKITLGLYEKDLNQDSPVVVIPLHTTARDIKAPTNYDSPILKEVKLRARANMLKWILELESEEEALNMLKGIQI
uniref:CSON007083 protein n=1 Tax=Culicoides sonorensis TaxID=179676 RepID=A0A336MYZ1_CULSO